MLLNIPNQRKAILQELQLLQKLRYKLSSQMRGMKQLQNLRKIGSLSRIILSKLSIGIQKTQVQKIDSIIINEQLELANSLKEKIKNQGILLTRFIQNGFLLPFSTIAYGICSKIYFNIDKIENKLAAIQKIKNQRKKKLNKL